MRISSSSSFFLPVSGRPFAIFALGAFLLLGITGMSLPCQAGAALSCFKCLGEDDVQPHPRKKQPRSNQTRQDFGNGTSREALDRAPPRYIRHASAEGQKKRKKNETDAVVQAAAAYYFLY